MTVMNGEDEPRTGRLAQAFLVMLVILVTDVACQQAPSSSPPARSSTPSETSGEMVGVNQAPSCEGLGDKERRLCRPIRVARSDLSTCGRASQQPPGRAYGRTVLGPGPVWPVASTFPVIEFERPGTGVDQPPDGGTWYGQKVGWLFAPAATDVGGALVRVFPIGHTGQAALPDNNGRWGNVVWMDPPAAAADSKGGPRLDPSSTAVTRAGCYAWQIDGAKFSYTIFFSAVTR